jgi:hypothetical protein
VRKVAAVVQRNIQGEGTAGVPAQDFAVEVLLSRLASADKAEGNGVAFTMVFPVDQSGGLNPVLHVLGAQGGSVEAAAGAVGCLAAAYDQL